MDRHPDAPIARRRRATRVSERGVLSTSFEEQAATVRTGIYQSEIIRVELGEAPLDERGQVITTVDAEVAFFRFVVGEPDAIRASHVLPLTRVVDLRAS